MAALCLMVDGAFAQTLPPVSRLAILVATGAASYGALLMLFARSLVAEIWGLVRR